MANNNCLSGIRCPICGQEDDFAIEMSVVSHVTDDGVNMLSDRVRDYDTDWDDSSYCKCLECGTEGCVGEFRARSFQKMFDTLRYALGAIHDALEVVPEGPQGADLNNAKGALQDLLEAGVRTGEKGNTYLSSGDGAHALIVDVGNSMWLVAEVLPDDVPAFSLSTKIASQEEMCRWVVATYPEWEAVTMGLTIELSSDGTLPESI